MWIKGASLVYNLGRLILPTYYRLTYGLQMQGIENIPLTGPVILASSHVNARDPIFLGLCCKRQVHYMAKASLFEKKFMRWVLRKCGGAFPVERGSGGEDALQEAYDLLHGGRIVGVFLEGTRSKDGALLRPKTGVSLLAFKTGAVVVPVSIIGQAGTCPQRKKGAKMMVNIGKPIANASLNIVEGSSMHFRRAAKLIMADISTLREEAITLLEGDV